MAHPERVKLSLRAGAGRPAPVLLDSVALAGGSSGSAPAPASSAMASGLPADSTSTAAIAAPVPMPPVATGGMATRARPNCSSDNSPKERNAVQGSLLLACSRAPTASHGQARLMGRQGPDSQWPPERARSGPQQPVRSQSQRTNRTGKSLANGGWRRSGLSCWFGMEPPPESNRRPHPYHGTTGNRCADPRMCRSRSTVRVEGIGSPLARSYVQSPGLDVADAAPRRPVHDGRACRRLQLESPEGGTSALN